MMPQTGHMTALCFSEPTLALLGRRVLMSEYLILYRCFRFALFVALYLIVPRNPPRTTSPICSPTCGPSSWWRSGRPSRACHRRHRPLAGSGHLPDQRHRRGFIVQSANPVIFEKSPLWGILLFENGRHPAPAPSWASRWRSGPCSWWASSTALSTVRRGMGPSPFMVTLVTSMFFGCHVHPARQSRRKSSTCRMPSQPSATSSASAATFFSVAAVMAVALGVVAHLRPSRTMFGRWLYGIGNNPRAAAVSGVPVKKVIVLTYVFSGFCARWPHHLYVARGPGPAHAG